jgi:uncharacterized repeat protein (TIGR03803 family)
MRNVYVLLSIGVTTILSTACGANTASLPSAKSVQTAQGRQVTNATSGYKLLYSFKGGNTDGALPIGTILTAVGSELYGTTSSGGSSGNGTIFAIDPSTSAEHPIYSFQGGSDGADPHGGLHDEDGDLYGTTRDGGGGSCDSGIGCGTVFVYTTSGEEKVIHAFSGSGDGQNPYVGVITAEPNATLYGTTYNGGANGFGTVDGVRPGGSGRFLYSFAGPPNDGSHPLAPVTAQGYGTLYGTTLLGGSGSCSSGEGCGTVFELNRSSRTDRIIYSFPGGAKGEFPASSVINDAGTLYGVTNGGGGSNSCGVFYKIDASTGKETPLYAFKGGKDGCGMVGDLLEYNGFFYGTNLFGGGTKCSRSSGTGCGTIFKLTTSGKETVLYRFKGGKKDGSLPQTSLMEYNGNLYGTTIYGGANDDGTVFEIAP